MSKNAVTPRVQKPPALMSSRASGLVLVDLRSKRSLSSGIIIIIILIIIIIMNNNNNNTDNNSSE